MRPFTFITLLAASIACTGALAQQSTPETRTGQTQPSPQNPQGQTPTPVSPEGGAPAASNPAQSEPATHRSTQPPQAAAVPTGASAEAQREAARARQMTEALKTRKSDAPAVVIRGGKLLTITKGVIENGAVVLRNGRIAYVGPAAGAPRVAGAKVIDATGMTVYPGLIDMQTDLGLVEIDGEPMTVDKVEPSDEITPQMHVFDGFHAESERIPITRVNGVTNALVVPAESNTLPGQDSFIQLAGRDRDEMLLVEDLAMPMNFGPEQKRGGRGGPGGQGPGGGGYPTTRMGLIAQMRQAFLDAQEYDRQLKSGKTTKRDLKLEALLPYLRGERPVIVGASEGSDVKTVMRLAQEFHLKVILNHVTHTQGVLDEIAAYKVPVIVGPIYDFPTETERYDAVFRVPAELNKRGVKIAFASYSSQFTRNLPYAAGYAVAFGLPYDEALKAITINPAEMLGLGDQFGSLEVGKWGNVVVANGDPLDVKTDVKHVFIAGREVPMQNRQIQLRDEYATRGGTKQ